MGIKQLADDHVAAEKEMIRFNTIKNEIDIFQQYLDPFVFEMKTPREHSVHSSVYRHLIRLQGVQDMGIPIYSLGSYLEDPNDKIIMPRTFQSFYRRIRRRNAADSIDVDLIPRPPRPRAGGAQPGGRA
ncbi:hypothetical protein P43SY_010977 [Pythium insidiosum]|uniref:Uncharacterized protein n=1 Tax=Pythium insidiosum TaxID=114742 RepID=A0AAD5Q918_PYTIN|nr:hypothetical protein P43SY_010977 [Pythium insidiosum]KAJ0403048.1 hypothetical protein ATCC90586_000670 [Pythium insidiosum]